MKLVSNGKVVLNGTYTEEDLNYLCLKALEIIVDKQVDLYLLKHSDSVQDYNDMRKEEFKLTTLQYEVVKEIAQ